MFNRKENKKLKNINSHNITIQNILAKLNALKVKYENNDLVVETLDKIILKVSYFTPLPKGDTRDVDKQILKVLEDIEVLFNKAEKADDYTVVVDKLKKVRELIAGR